jgi:hypothetical protein
MGSGRTKCRSAGIAVGHFSINLFGTDFRSCQPEEKFAFSPGVRPSNYYVAAITEFNDGKRGSSRYWGAMCCGK